VAFTAAASDDDGAIVAHDWDLDGDGAFDDAQGGQVTRAYTVAGIYEVGLRVTDDDGATDTDRETVVVGEPVTGSCRCP
jgi:PKD repeat protein